MEKNTELDYDNFYEEDGYPKQICRQCGNVIHLSCHVTEWEHEREWQFYHGDNDERVAYCNGTTDAGWYYLHFVVKVNGRASHRLCYMKKRPSFITD